MAAAALPMLVAGNLEFIHGRQMLVQSINKGAVGRLRRCKRYILVSQ